MTPDEITSVYDTLAQEVKDYGAAEAAKIGNTQRSLGTLASRVAPPSGQTNGLANYTYNRTMRPTVDSMAAQLIVQGKANALSKALNDALLAAKNKYEDAQNAYQTASSAAQKASSLASMAGSAASTSSGHRLSGAVSRYNQVADAAGGNGEGNATSLGDIVNGVVSGVDNAVNQATGGWLEQQRNGVSNWFYESGLGPALEHNRQGVTNWFAQRGQDLSNWFNSTFRR